MKSTAKIHHQKERKKGNPPPGERCAKMKNVSGYPIINLDKRKETTDEMKCIKFVATGRHFTFEDRKILEKTGNANAAAPAKSRLSLTAFATAPPPRTL